jgi:hypothetical protein
MKKPWKAHTKQKRLDVAWSQGEDLLAYRTNTRLSIRSPSWLKNGVRDDRAQLANYTEDIQDACAYVSAATERRRYHVPMAHMRYLLGTIS